MGEILANHISGKGFVSRIYKELLQFNDKRQMAQLKTRAKHLNK